MGLLDNFKKNKGEVLKQDLSQKEDTGLVFVMHLLMRDMTEMPSQDKMTEVMKKYLKDVDCFSYDENMAGFAVNKYKLEFKEGVLSPQLLVMKCMENERKYLNPLNLSQMWDCPESEKVFEACPYEIVVTDMLAGTMDYKERANMLMDFMEAMVELYPQCEAVYFQTSGKLMPAYKIREHKIPRDDRFIYFAVNVRFFNIEGTKDSIVDSLGMSTLFLPDLQYHFHGMNPDWVVKHAYNMLSYIYSNNNPIESGETVDGIADGNMSYDVRWKCQYENSLVQPVRQVIDVYMNEYAAGAR